jgi:hypothetical protein
MGEIAGPDFLAGSEAGVEAEVPLVQWRAPVAAPKDQRRDRTNSWWLRVRGWRLPALAECKIAVWIKGQRDKRSANESSVPTRSYLPPAWAAPD